MRRRLCVGRDKRTSTFGERDLIERPVIGTDHDGFDIRQYADNGRAACKVNIHTGIISIVFRKLVHQGRILLGRADKIAGGRVHDNGCLLIPNGKQNPQDGFMIDGNAADDMAGMCV